MEIKITGRHLDVSDEMKNLATRKVEKLAKFDAGIHLIEVILSREKIRFKVEIIVKSRHLQMETTGRDEDLHTCFDDVLSKMERRLREHREKIIDKKHRKGGPVSKPSGAEIEET